MIMLFTNMNIFDTYIFTK